jgi:hypothetical protein
LSYRQCDENKGTFLNAFTQWKINATKYDGVHILEHKEKRTERRNGRREKRVDNRREGVQT